jgi:predicted DNA-binding ribbon-helix-helix protein
MATPDGLRKRSLSIAGHRTSVSLEEPFWDALREIAEARGRSVQALVGEIDAGRGGQNLSSAIRVFVLGEVRSLPEHPDRPMAGAP